MHRAMTAWIPALLFLALGVIFSHASAEPTDAQGRAVLERVQPLAEQGNAKAQYNMGVIYDRGYGVPVNHEQARQWYRKAAAQGYARAAHNLAIMHQKGHGVAVDYARAVHWFRQAAENGEPAAGNNLAVMYAQGQGVPRNLPVAAAWAARAARAGNRPARTNLDIITPQLPAAQIEADAVAVRLEPDSDAGVIRRVEAGTAVVLLQANADWVQVLFPDDYALGWIMRAAVAAAVADDVDTSSLLQHDKLADTVLDKGLNTAVGGG